MALFFLIPLFTGLIGGYIFKKSSDEIGYLVGVFALVCIVLSLVLAPWQIQLMLLIFTLVITQRLLQQNEYKLKQVEDNHELVDYTEKKDPVSSKPMTNEVKDLPKPRYISYQATERTEKRIEGELAGKPLGTPLKIHTISRNA
ncbi:hypothetical protein SAMD00079811_39310 [Scytonema sp. HK-05]|uniref:hypothetical protein n=1 Tax=Scytonema sp. HK-05 TaxID=1137095 RepID=UPI000935CCCF|nr:hypothetical protein [Scytonema sp. HK-05]OKH60953.1 hypothetical protein NIES2130_00205 [Scytonema sp. HK-05]BAY46323.1 hypothetical protein SAMD00079811_39310 [Scytonema sp. HK-05]